MHTFNIKLGVEGIIIICSLLGYYSLSRSQTVLFNQKINSDLSGEIHNEEQIAINPTNPNNVVAVWRDFREGYRQVGVGYSTDAGETWKDTLIGLGIAPYPWESDPGLTVDRFGNFYALTLCAQAVNPFPPFGSLCVYKSTDGGATWGTPIKVVDSVAFEDKPLITCDQTGGVYDGNLYVCWSRVNSAMPESSGLFFSFSTNAGINWSIPKRFSHAPGNFWPVPAVGPNGEVYLGWQQSSIPNWPKDELVYSKSTDGGNNFTSPQTITILTTELSPFLNGFILTFAYPALGTDISNSSHKGNLYVAYMDKRNPTSDQDIFWSRSTDQGGNWSTPIRINDDPLDNNADQFFPWVSVNQDGIISVLFYDRRNDTANLLFDVYMSQSYDGGQAFTPNKKITTVSSYPLQLLSVNKFPYSPTNTDYSKTPMWASPLAGLIGEYIGISSYGSQNNLVWTDTREGSQAIYTAKVMAGLIIPNLVSPSNLSFINDTTPSFAWRDFSYYDTVSFYRLQYSLDKNFSTGVQTLDSLTDTTFVLPESLALAETTYYYWRVQSFNGGGDSSGFQDQPFSFTVDTDIPSIPSLISPAGTTNDSTPLFTWNSVAASNKLQNSRPQVASPVRYTWQLATDLGFTANLLEATNLSTNSYQLPNNQALDTGLFYYWRVKASDLAGNQSAFSAPLQFEYLAYIRGDVNADHLRNLGDIVYLVNYVFKGGPPPMIGMAAGDVNCDTKVNLGDIVMLVNFVFKGGPPPCN